MADRFPTPFEIPVPPGAEGWEEMYPYSVLFSPDRKEYEESQFWFIDGVHVAKVLPPWDLTMIEFAFYGLGQNNTRTFVIPPARGVDFRIFNGYFYLSPIAITDPAEIESRIPEFAERAGYYFQNWDRLYEAWLTKVRALIGELDEISFAPLPDREDMAVVTEGRGLGSGFGLLTSYNRLVDLCLKLWNYHFEFLNLGYAAYLDFFGFCKGLFPSIPDQAIAKMVAGIEVDLFRPDAELKKLAQLAVDLEIADRLTGAAAAVVAELASDAAGQKWLAAWQEAHEPWFNYSSGTAFYHEDKVWAEHPDIPLEFIRNYVEKLQSGQSLERPKQAIEAERDRVVGEYTELIDDDESRETFQAKLGLARTVFPYVENHEFYVEHWGHSVAWRKMRELGAVLAKEGFLAGAEDIFLLQRNEVPTMLADYYHSWAIGGPARGPKYWPAKLSRRAAILQALQEWTPPPALGATPEVITEPFSVMLWGVTSDSVGQWLRGDEGDPNELSGFAASPGVAEGVARVIRSADRIGELEPGEILVAPSTAPSWAPIFGKIAATVTDVGGMMSHAAIVCREYGLPAVTGTSFATTNIKTGQRLRVDGNTGQVTILP